MRKLDFFVLLLLFCIFICHTVPIQTVASDLSAAHKLTVGENREFSSLTEAVDAASDGDEIVIYNGTYDSSTEQFPIIIDKSLYIHSAGEERTVIDCQELKVTMKLIAPDITLENLDISFIRYGVYVLADDICISDCTFELSDEKWRETSCGMWAGGAKRMTLNDCSFTDCGIAIAGPEVTPGKKGVPVLTALFEVGEDEEFFNTHTITGNTVNGMPLAYEVGLENCRYSKPCGQLIAVDSHDVVFEDLDVSKASIGIQIAYSDNIIIRNSYAADCGVFGIYICKSGDCQSENIIADGSAHGVDIRASQRCIVKDCRTNHCGQGIFYSFGYDCITQNCEMKNDGTGYFSAGGGNNTVKGCEIAGNELGLYIQHEPFTVTDTMIYGNTSCGLRFTDAIAYVSGCNFENNFVSAMALDGSSGILEAGSFSASGLNSVYIKESPDFVLGDNEFAAGELEKVEISEQGSL